MIKRTARKGQHRMPHETGNNFPTHQPKTGERNGSRVQREIRTMRSQIQREIRTVRSCREWGIEVWGEGASTDQQAARHRLFTHRLSILVQPVCQTELKHREAKTEYLGAYKFFYPRFVWEPTMENRPWVGLEWPLSTSLGLASW